MSEHGEGHYEGGYPEGISEKQQAQQQKAIQDYSKIYVYGSYAQPGLERTLTYLTPREREIQEGKAKELYEKSLEERSGILVRAEEQAIIAEQHKPKDLQSLATKFGTVATEAYGISGRLAGIQESLIIQQYKMKGYELVGRREGELVFAMPEPPKGIAETLASYITKPLVDIPRLFGVPRTPQEALTPPSMRKETVRPFAGIAAYLVTPTERLVYSVGRLVGFETPRLPPSLLSLSAEERAAAMAYGSEYAAGSVMGEVLLSMGISKGISAVAPPIMKGIEKIVGFAEKTAVPESYYYYKYILEKPMLTTITKEYVKGTVEALIGEEAYLYTTKIAVPTLLQKTLPEIAMVARTTIMESPLGEAYLYGKAVAYPTFKYMTWPQIEAYASELGASAKTAFMESPIGEAYLYGKTVAYPTFEYTVKTKIAEVASMLKGAVFESPLGEAYLYTKGVAIPQYVAAIKGIPKMLPSMPFDLSELKWYAESYVSEIKLGIKSYMGKEYFLPMPEQPSYAMKPLWQPQKIVEFAEKPIAVDKSYLMLKETGEAISKQFTETFAPTVTAFATQTYETMMHGWKGAPYPFRTGQAQRIVEDLEETFLHYPKEPLTITKPKAVSAVGISTSVFAMPKLKELTGAIPKLETISIMNIATTPEAKQLQRYGQFQEQFLKQTQQQGLFQQQEQFQQQFVKQTQQQAQQQTQLLKQSQIQTQKQLFDDSLLRKRYRKKGVRGFGFYTRYHYQNPIATAKQVLERFL